MFAVLLIFGLLLYFFYYHLVQKRQGLPPGPMPFPIIGNMFQIDQKSPFKTFLEWSKQFGPVFTVWMGPSAHVFVTDFRLMKEYFIKQGDIYSGRPAQFVLEMLNSGRFGIVLPDGQFWREQRRFALHVLRDFGVGRNVMEEKINIEIEALVGKIEESIGSSGSGRVLSLKQLVELCVGNIINGMMFGIKHEEGSEKFFRVKKLMDESLKTFTSPEVQLLDAYPWLRHVPLFQNFGYKTLCAQRTDFYRWFEAEIRACKQRFNPIEEASDYVSAYLKEVNRREVSSEDLGNFTDWQLTMTVFDLLFAGLETTTTTLQWAVLFMMHNPKVQEKCAKEIQDLLESRSDQAISMSDRSKLPYTAATLNETQRLGNVLAMNLLHTVTQDTNMEGHILKQGTIVVPQVSAVLNDPKMFPDPDVFKPERFLEDDRKSLKKVEELVPFSIGKRACMGESLARMELFLIFTALFRNFHFSGREGEELPTLEPVPAFTRAPAAYQVLIKRR